MEKQILGREAAFFEENSASTTAREILQQPRLWRVLADSLAAQEAEISAFLRSIGPLEGLRVVFTGAGSSAFIGQSLQMILARQYNLRSEAVATTDIVSSPGSVLYDVPTLLVSFSRSGESPESVAALQYAAQKVKTLYNLVLVCKAGSSLANAAQAMPGSLVLLMPPESSDKGFAMTSSVSCMALAAFCFFGWAERGAFLPFVHSLAALAETELEEADELARQVAGFGYERLVFLGSGGLKGLAEEGAVKSMELTNGLVNAGFNTAMGFRHGPKTVVNPCTLSVHMVSPLAFTARYDLDLAGEILRERQGNRVLLSLPEGTLMDEGADYVWQYRLTGAPFAELEAYLHNLLLLQLLSLEKSLASGVPTDNPCTGGEVNRVVQGVTIYPL